MTIASVLQSYKQIWVHIKHLFGLDFRLHFYCNINQMEELFMQDSDPETEDQRGFRLKQENPYDPSQPGKLPVMHQ